jgi:large subunit ribosomal protein L29
MAKISKVRELSVGELEQEVQSLSEQLFRLRFQQATGQLENALKIREIRKGLARVKTVLMEKQKQADH